MIASSLRSVIGPDEKKRARMEFPSRAIRFEIRRRRKDVLTLKLQSKRELQSAGRLGGNSLPKEGRTEIADKPGIVHFIENIKGIHG